MMVGKVRNLEILAIVLLHPSRNLAITITKYAGLKMVPRALSIVPLKTLRLYLNDMENRRLG